MIFRTNLQKLFLVVLIGWLLGVGNIYAQQKKVPEQIHEIEYAAPLPLQSLGEKIDVLVRIKEVGRAHHFNLIFVEKRNWPDAKKEGLMKIYRGKVLLEPETVPYPVKLRFRLDSHDSVNAVSVDTVVAERKSVYFTRYAKSGTEIWRANLIYAAGLEPGIYRVRIENMNAVPEIDFETLFGLERDSRKY